MNLDSNVHSVFLLHYHLVLVVKYRRQVFDDNISNRAKEIFEYIVPNYNITLEEWNHDKDHVHICPACGGKVTIRTGKDGKLKLECINYYEKGRTCPNKYNIEDYIKITY